MVLPPSSRGLAFLREDAAARRPRAVRMGRAGAYRGRRGDGRDGDHRARDLLRLARLSPRFAQALPLAGRHLSDARERVFGKPPRDSNDLRALPVPFGRKSRGADARVVWRGDRGGDGGVDAPLGERLDGDPGRAFVSLDADRAVRVVARGRGSGSVLFHDDGVYRAVARDPGSYRCSANRTFSRMGGRLRASRGFRRRDEVQRRASRRGLRTDACAVGAPRRAAAP